MVHMYALKLVVGRNERRHNRMQNLVIRINPMKITKSFNRGTWLRCKGHEKMIEQKSRDHYYQRLRKCKFHCKVRRGGTTRICGTIRIVLNMVL